jgi:hypothetical protein
LTLAYGCLDLRICAANHRYVTPPSLRKVIKRRWALNISDIVIHISETLDDSGIHGLQREIGEENGVYSACMHEKTRHLMVVDFDPMEVRPSHLVHAVRERGLHAVMVGL